MCDLYDVLEASKGHAAKMTTTFWEYGGNNMGEGVRQFAQDVFAVGKHVGYEQGVEEIYPIAFDDGHMAGWCQGFESGRLEGMLKGSLITLAVTGVWGLTAWGIKKYVEHKKVQLQSISVEEEMSVEQQNQVEYIQEQ